MAGTDPGAACVAAARKLARAVHEMRFSAPVAYVYNPLVYARATHERYLRQYANTAKRVLFLGMNPGPFGMAQNGVPFGETGIVRDWLGITGRVGHPDPEHPKRPITGLACERSEVSGARLWGLFRARYRTPERFFAEHFVTNYCPLVFLSASGANLTPDKLPAHESAPLMAACDEHLRRLAEILRPAWVIGVGKFAEARARAAFGASGPRIAGILHPSPASPAANKDWSGQATRALEQAGVW